ncbi:MAG: proline dehydrogenase family protein [Bacteroidetes bacterium]|nr:proline dehydrogenase family protein [Bacteroidota bacterium]
MLDFNDTKTAFILKSDNQLRKAYWLFRLVANSSLVGLGRWASDLAIKLGLPIRSVVKQTVYDQFVGGETIEECQAIIDKLQEHGVSALLDFAVEGKDTEADFNACKDEIVETIRHAAKHPGIPFGVFKMTGVASFDLMEKISAGKKLTEIEERAWDRAKTRVDEICFTAKKHGLRIMIDAEETWIQKAIDEVAMEMMATFNQEKVVVITTMQMYRKDRLAFLKESMLQAKEGKYCFGAKLVRGAYMEKERERAIAKGYEDPIHKTKADSDSHYNAGMIYMAENLESCMLIAGSHNEDSARILAEKVEEFSIERSDERVWFSQLYGMSDNLSFNLAKEGYNVVKYLPFGPVTETLPYLIRRAEENTSASGQSNRELGLIKKEMKRRGIS